MVKQGKRVEHSPGKRARTKNSWRWYAIWPCLVLAPCDSSALRVRQAMRGCQGEIAAWPLCNRRAENTRNSTRKWFGKKKVVASRKRAKRARRRAKLAAVAEEARVALAGDEHGQVLQRTLANGCEWDLRTCSDAASHGRLEAVALAEHCWCCQRLLSECSARANTVKYRRYFRSYTLEVTRPPALASTRQLVCFTAPARLRTRPDPFPNPKRSRAQPPD